MSVGTLGPSVYVVNRLTNDRGHSIPYEAYVDGTAFKIAEGIHLPTGIARILVHNSMYAIDPISNAGQYKLGVEAWGMPIDALPITVWKRPELVERPYLGPERQHGRVNARTGKKLQLVSIHNPVRRHDPVAMNIPGPAQDGAHPGSFGDAFTK